MADIEGEEVKQVLISMLDRRLRLLLPREIPEHQYWAFVGKVYFILTLQLLLTIAMAAVLHPISQFFLATRVGVMLCIILGIMPIIVLCPLISCHDVPPVKTLLVAVFGLTLAVDVGFICAVIPYGKVLLESVILTSVVFATITPYTFWAAIRGHDRYYLGLFVLVGPILVLMVFTLIQIFYPFGKLSVSIFGALLSIIFCLYIIFTTEKLVTRYFDDGSLWAYVSFYVNILTGILGVLAKQADDD